ncbi:hypothetical protein Zmor_003385 [Zophobas morio]|uniref:Uncharacterized protein n=1 Tax=Zophobas morio TaxID=2755281 RepID=A0AA38HM26_9CUCU|nr:hypothetical protein Zmor_003385 [Zophobas morio]
MSNHFCSRVANDGLSVLINFNRNFNKSGRAADSCGTPTGVPQGAAPGPLLPIMRPVRAVSALSVLIETKKEFRLFFTNCGVAGRSMRGVV